ncbi:MAG: histidine phosphatase family protein [Anaerolineales bacterium]
MPTLLLIRHGENDYLAKNKLPGHIPGIHLNKRGKEQAADLDQSLRKLPIKAIYCSPLERAVETAQPLAKSLKLDIQIRPDLTDGDVGEWAGRSWKVLRRNKLWKIIQENPSQFQFPGGESFIQIQERVVASLEAIAGGYKNEMIAVVFHADPIKLGVAHYLGLPLDNFQRLTINAGSITILKITNSGGQLLAMNLMPPLPQPKT